MILNTSLRKATELAIKLCNVYSLLKKRYTNFLSNWGLVLILLSLVKSYMEGNDSDGVFNGY